MKSLAICRSTSRPARVAVICLALLAAAPASASASGGSPVGWWWTLKGNRPGEKARVTLLKVVKNVTTDGYQEPARGYNFVGIKVRIKNIGRVMYDDSPSNGAELFTRSGSKARSTIISGGNCDSEWASGTKIFPGSSQTGCIAFEARKGAWLGSFQFTLNSGFGPQTGRWKLHGRVSTRSPSSSSPDSGDGSVCSDLEMPTDVHIDPSVLQDLCS